MVDSCTAYGVIINNSSSLKAISYSCSWANALLTCPTVFGNVALIAALSTSRDKKKPCTLLLLNLAVTDLLAGLVSMPSFFYVFRSISLGQAPCSFVSFSSPFAFIICGTSTQTVALIAVERYASVFHPFCHRSKINCRMSLLFAGLSWILSLLSVVPSISGLSSFFLNVSVAAITVICTVLSIFCYLRILLRARRVRSQVQNQAARFGQANNSITDKRYVSVGGLIILSMVICFSPVAASNWLWILGYRNRRFDEIRCWEWTLVVSNSIVNPIITCIFCPPMRRKVLKILTCRLCCEQSNQ